MVRQTRGEIDWDPHYATGKQMLIGFAIMFFSVMIGVVDGLRHEPVGYIVAGLFVSGWWICKFGFYTPLHMLRSLIIELLPPRP